MKKYSKVLVFILICIATACSNNLKNNNRLLSNEMIIGLKKISNNWKSDSTGCFNQRLLLINNDELKYDSLLGQKITIATQYLGEPNIIRTTDSENKYFYCITCKYAPIVKNHVDSNSERRLNTEAELLYFYFNSDSIITSSGLMLP